MTIEPTTTQSPSSETEVHSGEDFVHIDDPRPTGDISLSDSIVNVDKDELLDDEAARHREEEEFKDSDSVVSGGDGDGIDGGDAGESSSETVKAELPDELAKSVVILTCESTAEGGSCDVYLVGTAHVSKQSCLEVEAIISFLKPEVVFVELCSSRLSVLKPQTLKIPTMSDMIESWKQKQNTFGILYGWFLAKIASHLEVFPGAEFRVAYEEAIKYGGKVILGDRPVQITLKRTWAKMPLWHKVKFLYSILFQAVFLPSAEELEKMLKDMDDVDMLTLVIQEMSKEFPTLMDTIVHERDQYMASSLLRVASEHSSVVAVIGKGHINGIKKNWKQPITMNDLMEIPSDKSVFTVKRIISSVAMAVAGTAIVSGILLARRR
ncbi:PREDICTED: traB domain-containing protein-like [Camelina sativa]|uniref:TraB domain-containing protein-like n=1 Tax=Camelina sativa TaxID=90675 RepID=A0ABM0XER5_CAMSA|nr:PREDICTED: traB domain-containing protein-like [Camelina sativa]